MFCEVCGARMEEDSVFCPECGARLGQNSAPVMQAPGQQAAVPPAGYMQGAGQPANQAYYQGQPQPGPEHQQSRAGTGYQQQETVYLQPEMRMNYQTPPAKPAKPPKKPVNKKIFIIIGAAAAVLVALVILGILFLPEILSGGISISGSGNTAPKLFCFYSNGEKWVAPEAGLEVNDFLNDEEVLAVGTNVRKNAALIRSEDSVWFFDGTNTAEIREIDAEELYNGGGFICGFVGDGKDFTYCMDDTLWLYHAGQSTAISDEGALKDVSSGVSPIASSDGKYFAYAIPTDGSDYRSYVWDGKKMIEIGKNKYVVGITDGGRKLYYVDKSKKTDKSSLIVRKGIEGDKEETLISTDEGGLMVAATRGAKELLIYTPEGKIYHSEDGKAPVKIASSNDFNILAPYSEGGSYAVSQTSLGQYSLYAGTMYVDSFKNKYYIVDDTLYYLNGKQEMNRVAKHVMDAYVASDGKTVLYRDDEYSLYRVDGTKAGTEEELLIEEDCIEFVPSADGKTVFYENGDEELMCFKGGKTSLISDEADAWMSYSALLNGKILAYLEDNELYLSDGSKGEAVRGMNQEVLDYYAGEGYLVVDGEEEYLYTTDGKKFSVIYEK